MHLPVPNNKLVAFTLAGALLTAIVAGALAIPGQGLAQMSETDEPASPGGSNASQQTAADAPTPNQEFTPSVQTQSGYEDDEYEEHEDEDEYDEAEDEDDEDEAEEEEAEWAE